MAKITTMRVPTSELGISISQQLSEWLEGKGEKDTAFRHSTRTVLGQRHEAGYASQRLKVAGIMAHPDDYILFSGLEMKFVDDGDLLRPRNAGLVYVTATDGRGRPYLDNNPAEVGRIRIGEDRKGARRMRANVSLHLGFETDSRLHEDQEELTGVLYDVFTAVKADIYILPSDVDDHKDHRTVAKSSLTALRSVVSEQNIEPPIVFIADREDGLIVPGKEPTLYYPLSDAAYDRHVRTFDDHVTQTGPHLSLRERNAVDKVRNRPIENTMKFAAPGVSYIGKARQVNEFSQADPSEYMVGEVFSAA